MKSKREEKTPVERVFVLDIDEVLATKKGKTGDYVLNQGVLEFLQFLDQIPNSRFCFFSAGGKQRNLKLIPRLLKQALGKTRYEEIKDRISIYSVSDLDKDKKKNLEKVLRTGETLSSTILIDDRAKNLLPSQTQNGLVVLKMPHTLLETPADYKAGNQIFYAAGIIKELLQHPPQKILEQLAELHRQKEEKAYEQSSHYLNGLETLRRFNPELEFKGEAAYPYFTGTPTEKTDVSPVTTRTITDIILDYLDNNLCFEGYKKKEHLTFFGKTYSAIATQRLAKLILQEDEKDLKEMISIVSRDPHILEREVVIEDHLGRKIKGSPMEIALMNGHTESKMIKALASAGRLLEEDVITIQSQVLLKEKNEERIHDIRCIVEAFGKALIKNKNSSMVLEDFAKDIKDLNSVTISSGYICDPIVLKQATHCFKKHAKQLGPKESALFWEKGMSKLVEMLSPRDVRMIQAEFDLDFSKVENRKAFLAHFGKLSFENHGKKSHGPKDKCLMM